MPLMSELKNGDEVEILISKTQTPPAAWEGVAVTGKARSAIRRATREALRAQYSTLGREILGRAFTRVGKSYRKSTIERILPRLSQNSADEVLTAVGRGELPSADVVQAAFPDIPRPKAPRRRIAERSGEGWFGLTKVIGLKFRFPGVSPRDDGKHANSIPIKGLKGDLPVRFAATGGAVPGDPIVGIMEPGVGITIYPIHGKALEKFTDQPERWIDVRWDIDEKNEERFPAQIQVTAMNEPGSLAQVAQVIGEVGGNIDNIKTKRVVEDYTDMLIDLEVRDREHLNEIISGLRSKSVVSAVKRTHQ